jgi:hypothetical protein
VILRMLMITTILLGLPPSPSANDRSQAPSETAPFNRLPPSAFARLPRNIVRHLQARGCTIPQYAFKRRPHNVISGAFARQGQRDWAVLCSRNGFSSILVFWSGRTDAVTELARLSDHIFVQREIGSDKAHYARVISAVNKDYIISHYQAYKGSGAPEPPPISHQGIDDGYMEKASTVHYYYRGKWRALQGAD